RRLVDYRYVVSEQPEHRRAAALTTRVRSDRWLDPCLDLPQYATQDSNLRPSAPEAEARWSERAVRGALGPSWDGCREVSAGARDLPTERRADHRCGPAP